MAGLLHDRSCIAPCRADRSNTVEHGGYSPYVANSRLSLAAMYDAGGYASYVDQGFLLRPKPVLERRLHDVYTQNYNMEPHYGQQYPDRQPFGLNAVNERAWRRERAVDCRPV